MKATDKNQLTNKSVSRRSILKGAIALGAMTVGSGLALNIAKPGTAEAMTKKFPKKWDETWDVVVVGSGFAGLAAASEAARTGAKVVIIEKMPIYGGNSIISGGTYNAPDDKFHLREKLNRGNDSPQLHKEDMLKGGDYYNIPGLVEVMTNGATDALNWLIDEGGLQIRQIVTRGGGHSGFRGHLSVEASGRPNVEAVRKIGEKRGVKIRTETELTWIWRRDADSPVEGVEVKKGKKLSNIKINKALVLASGGFSRDIKMRMAFNPGIVSEFNSTNQPGATGEVIRYAQAIGADALQLAFIQLYPCAEPESGTLDTSSAYGTRGAGFGVIYVDKQGRRFISELARRDVVSYAQIKLGAKPTYSILTLAMMKKMDAEKDLVDGVKKGRFIEGKTIEELASKVGLPKETFVSTIMNYNKNMAEGKDPEFGKKIAKEMMPISEGPFYALPQWPAVHHTMGGLRINNNAQVIDIWGKPIQKLYAAGEVTGGVHGSNRLSGNAYTDCFVFGRVAGMNAAKEKA